MMIQDRNCKFIRALVLAGVGRGLCGAKWTIHRVRASKQKLLLASTNPI